MKFLLLLLLSIPINIFAQGWPGNYQGVMLQAFYWDSYSDTKWTNLTAQADELAHYFKLMWIPNSGYCNTGTNGISMGYDPVWWFRHDSSFGTEAELRTMINTLSTKGVGVIEDVVINHKNGNTNWCDFPTETWNNQTITWTLADICKGDDDGRTEREGYMLTGAADTGDDFNGYRDLDHTSLQVQNNVKIYLDFLQQELGYAGFRYDMVKGYHPRYTKLYNEYAQPTYSVGEYWDGSYEAVTNWIKGTGYQSAAFDFPLKDVIQKAFGNDNWNALESKGIAGDPKMSRYSVTFVDNHDTYRESYKLSNNVLAANAFILAMPGTPCIFLPHWQAYKEELKKMIQARQEAGITNQSPIISQQAYTDGYVTIVQGTHKKIMVISGYPQGVDTNGYTPISTGTADNPNYQFLISDEETELFTPTPLTYEDGKYFAYFEAPADWGNNICAWVWDKDNGDQNYTGGNWPGESCTRHGQAASGNTIYKWIYTGSLTNMPTHIIFNNGNQGKQTADMYYRTGGYYTANAIMPDYLADKSTLIVDRLFTEGQNSTVCLPFSMSETEMESIQGAAYQLINEESGVLYFKRVQAMQAFHPYLFVASATGKSFEHFKSKAKETGTPVTDKAGNFYFVGTDQYMNIRSGNGTTYFGYKESDGTFVKIGTTTGGHIGSYRCFFYTNSSTAAAKRIVLEDHTTNTIQQIDLEASRKFDVYSLDGRLVRKANAHTPLPRGIYIVNHRKLIVHE